VQTSYSYDGLNRLTQMGSAKNGPLSSYAYALGAAGNRLTVAELSGRNVAYGYDSLYRLTTEAVTADPNNHNVTNGYLYDAVGNRQQWLINGATVNSYTYDADDRLGADTYDADGNTINSLGTANSYDFENHLIQHGSVTLVYDGDGNRVSETVGGVTTNYLVDTVNPTGYAQVVDELVSGKVTRSYSYGMERLSESQTLNSSWTPSFYGYDGHGSVRQLTNSAGAITDTYDYDAFGNLINSTGSTPNNYLFAGEQYDPALSLYYNRARYYNNATGRFWSMDTFEGDVESPLSLHKYLYTGGDPVNRFDRNGHDFDLGSLTTSLGIGMTIASMSNVLIAGVYSAVYGGFPDAVGFGAFVAGGSSGFPVDFGGIFGLEVIYAPRLRKTATYLWGGFEPAATAPSLTELLHRGLHGEGGGFTSWSWNVPDLNPERFALFGVSAAGAFFGQENAMGTATTLFGFTNDPSLSIFGIAGGEIKLSESTLSEGAMVSQVAAAQAAFQGIAAARSGAEVDPAAGVAGAILSSGLSGAWVHYTYGKGQ